MEPVYVRRVGKVPIVVIWIRMLFSVFRIVPVMEHSIWIHSLVSVNLNGPEKIVLEVKTT